MSIDTNWTKTVDELPIPKRPVLIYGEPGDWYGVYWIEENTENNPNLLDRWWTNRNRDHWPCDGVAITHWAYFPPATDRPY